MAQMQSSMRVTLTYSPSTGEFSLGIGELEYYSHSMKFTFIRSETGQSTGLLIEPLAPPDIDMALGDYIVMKEYAMVPIHNWA